MKLCVTVVEQAQWGEGGCLFVIVYVLATSKVIPGRVLTYDSTHSWRLNSTASLVLLNQDSNPQVSGSRPGDGRAPHSATRSGYRTMGATLIDSFRELFSSGS